MTFLCGLGGPQCAGLALQPYAHGEDSTMPLMGLLQGGDLKKIATLAINFAKRNGITVYR
jgi:hypothetical protein